MAVFDDNEAGESEQLYLRTIEAPIDPGCGCALCQGGARVIGGSGSDALQPASLKSADALPYYISALLPSGTWRWNDTSDVGTPVNVTFSFMTQAPDYATSGDRNGFAPMNGDAEVSGASGVNCLGRCRQHHIYRSLRRRFRRIDQVWH